MKMKMVRVDGLAICKALGYVKARRWNNQRLARKLAQLINSGVRISRDAITDDDERKRLNVLLAPERTVVKTEAKPEQVEKPRVKKPKKVKTKTKQARAPRAVVGPKIEGKLEGVSSYRNRLFYCGVVLRKHGLEEGLTEEIIEEVDSGVGCSNPEATHRQLAHAWHVLNGYLNG